MKSYQTRQYTIETEAFYIKIDENEERRHLRFFEKKSGKFYYSEKVSMPKKSYAG